MEEKLDRIIELLEDISNSFREISTNAKEQRKQAFSQQKQTEHMIENLSKIIPGMFAGHGQ